MYGRIGAIVILSKACGVLEKLIATKYLGEEGYEEVDAINT